MNLDKRLITALVFGVLTIGLFLLVQNVDLSVGSDEDTEPTAEAQELMFPEIQNDLVSYIEVTSYEAEQVFEVEQVDGEWVVLQAPEDSDTGLGLDPMSLMNPLFSLPGLTPDSVLEQIESFSVYGLDDAQYTVNFRTSSGREVSMEIGDKNPGGTAYYVQLPDDDRVYLVSTFYLDGVIRLVEQPPFVQPTPDPAATPTDA